MLLQPGLLSTQKVSSLHRTSTTQCSVNTFADWHLLLQTAKFFSTIEDALATKADQAVKVNTLGGLADVCKIVGRACEPFIIPLLTPVLLAAGDKVRSCN